MTITLPPDQIAWLEAAVAEGRFPSVDAAVAEAVGSLISEASADDIEIADWMLPMIEEGVRDIAEGRVVPLEEFCTRMERRARRAEGQ
jgi:Arc/MetJ-type ribon-helix-helix transcriptional regulator